MSIQTHYSSIWQKVQATPWKHSFYGLLRLNDIQHASLPRTGCALKPQHEAIRITQMPSFAFAPSELAKVEIQAGVPKVYMYGAGLLGPNGALPQHYTEIIREALFNRKDSTVLDFLEIFQHRYYTFLYRSWAQSQAVVQMDRLDDDHFTNYFSRLAGFDMSSIKNKKLPAYARVASVPYLVGSPRTIEGLESSLAHYFQVPLKIKEFSLQWMRIDEEDCTYLGTPRLSSYLGEGAVLGKEVPDCQSKFTIVIGPMTLKDYKRFTPKGDNFKPIIEFVRTFIGFEMQWDIELVAKASEAHPAQLGGDDELGWSTWLGEDPDRTYAVGMVFEPELYMKRI